MLRRYQNEAMLLVALLLLLGAMIFKTYSHSQLETKSLEASKTTSKIEDIATMKKLWQNNKEIPQKLKSIKSTVGASKINKFKIEKKKADIILVNLNGTQLNKIIGKQLASIPIQIVNMSVERSGESYRLELLCKW
ncbi:MAG: hypothetical protein HF962_03325 [Sulfurovum sp.]|nr:hypothetical protein [Sulfurovum sp.]